MRRHARLEQEGPNPFVDPEGYRAEIDAVETLFMDVLQEQRAAAGK